MPPSTLPCPILYRLNNTAKEDYNHFGIAPIVIDGGGVVLDGIVVDDTSAPGARPFLWAGHKFPDTDDVTGSATVITQFKDSCTPLFNASGTGNHLTVTCDVAAAA